MLDTSRIRKDFPVLSRIINGRPVVYLDSTATSLKPAAVIDAVNRYYTQCTANVFRGIYTMSEEATALYEGTREKVASFINAESPSEIVFTRNTSESLNLVGYSWLPDHAVRGGSIVATVLEHHSNFVPWQQHAARHGMTFSVCGITPEGELDLAGLERLVTKKTVLVAVTAASNVLGTITPVAGIVAAVKRINPSCLVVVDAAQAVPHMPVDVRAWGADAVAFSGHKMLGPSGIGVLWMRRELLADMKPFLYGGDMIREVHVEDTQFNDVPHKFEAGTPNIEGTIGLGAAVDYLTSLGMDSVRAHEREMTAYALQRLSEIDGVTVYGPTDPAIRGGVVAFRLGSIHPHDIAQILDGDNVCIRVGYHCAMPLHECLGIHATARASFYVYTDRSDIDALVAGLENVRKLLG